MRKLLYITATLIIPTLVACGDFSEKNANKEYVIAAKRVASAEKAFNAADYASALELCATAKNEVEKIVETYPDTSLSLKIVSDGSMRIGACKYADLRDNIIPRLELFNMPEMKSLDVAWAIAVDNDAYESFAVNLIKNYDKFDADKIGKIIEIAISKVKSTRSKGALRSAFVSAVNAKSKPATKAVKTEVAEKKSVEKIDDTKAFLREANTAASLVSYDLNAISKLRDMAKFARDADKPTRDAFASSLSKAYDNILKISTPSVREKAFATMATAFAYFGDALRAIATSQKITNESLFYEVFKAIGENSKGGANYKETLTLASRLKNDAERAKFLSSLAIDVAKRYNFEGAKEIAGKVEDVSLKNLTYASIAKLALDGEKFAEAASCVASIDVKNLECLSVFDEGKVNPQTANCERLARLSSKFVKHNPKLATALNNLALSSLNSSDMSRLNYSPVLVSIFDNFVKLDNVDGALNFVMNNLHRVNVSLFKDSLCGLVMNSKNADLSKKATKLLSDIYADGGDFVEFAVLLAANGVSRADAVKILSDMLPKFTK